MYKVYFLLDSISGRIFA